MKNNRQLRGRILSLVLTAAMVCALLPTTAFAQEGRAPYHLNKNGGIYDKSIAPSAGAGEKKASPSNASVVNNDKESVKGDVSSSNDEESAKGDVPSPNDEESGKSEIPSPDDEAGNLTDRITSWEWIDPDGNLSGGVLSLPGISKDNPADFDKVVSMLPEKIAVYMAKIATESNAEKHKELTLDGWSCEAFRQDEQGDWPMQGEYTFTASLPEGYALSENTEPLEVQVRLGGGNLLLGLIGTGDFTVTGGELNTDYSYSSEDHVLTILTQTPLTVSGTTTTDRIVIKEGITANLTLDNVKINKRKAEGDDGCALFIQDQATLKLTLKNDNTLESGMMRAGILVPAGANLVITAESTGTVDTYGRGTGTAGIGSGGTYDSGNITINGGTVIARDNIGCGRSWDPGQGVVTVDGDAVVYAYDKINGATEHITKGLVFEKHKGEVYGSPTLKSDLTINEGDTLTIGKDKTLSADSGATIINRGTITNDGTLDIAGALENHAKIVSSGNLAINTLDHIAEGSIEINGSATLTNNGTWTNNGSIRIGKGCTFTNTGAVTNSDSGQILNLGTMNGGGSVNGTPVIVPEVLTKPLSISDGSLRISSFPEDGLLIVQNETYYQSMAGELTLTGKTAENSITIEKDTTAQITMKNLKTELGLSGNPVTALNIQENANVTITLTGQNELKGTSGYNNVSGGDGISCGEHVSLTINGDGTLDCTGGNGGDADSGTGGWGGAGIKGNATVDGGTLTVTGGFSGNNHGYNPGGSRAGGNGFDGTLTMESGKLTAIGGKGNNSNNGLYNGGNGGNGITRLIQSGGTVTALGGDGGDRSWGGSKHGSKGCGVITAQIGGGRLQAQGGKQGDGGGEGIKVLSSSGSCIVLSNGAGTVYGDYTMNEDFELRAEQTLTIGNGCTLTIEQNTTLTNRGTIDNQGTLVIKGTLKNYGTISGNSPENSGGTIQNPSQITVSFTRNNESIVHANYGDSITITAAISARAADNVLRRNAPLDTVDFWLGTVDTGTKLNTDPISVVNGSASLPVTLTEDLWKPGNYTIIADYGGSGSLVEVTGTGKLTIANADRTIPAPAASEVTYNSVTLAQVTPSAGDGTVEYGYSDTNDSSGIDEWDWQADTTFSGLYPGQTHYFFARVTSGTNYNDAVSAGTEVTTTAVQEQFNLSTGQTYYFDLSGEKNGIGTINGAVPDQTLHYVPFTYEGTVRAYSLGEESSGNTSASEHAVPGIHSLFVADYNVSHTVSWDDLNSAGCIFGKSFDTNYTLRSLSVGNQIGVKGVVPITNEWDSILEKNNGRIQNWDGIFSWGQDTASDSLKNRAVRGYGSDSYWEAGSSAISDSIAGFRPALEVRNPDTLGKNGLKAVTLHLNGGRLKDSGDDINIVCAGTTFTAPSGESLTAPREKLLFDCWNTTQDGAGTSYAAGASVPNSVTALYAKWILPKESTPLASFTATGADSGTLTGLISGANYKYSLDGGTQWTEFTGGSMPISSGITTTHGVQIVKEGVASTTADSEVQTILITKGEAVIGITATGCTNAGNNDGKLIGVTAAMEYSIKGGSSWKDGAGSEITGLTSGIYLVRTKANGTALSGDPGEYTISAYAPPAIYTITFGANGGTVTPANGQTNADGKLASLPEPSRRDYRFEGWFTAASGGTAVTTETAFTQDSTIYAHWFYTGGGSSSEEDSDTTVTTPPATPENPTPPTDGKIEVGGKVDGNGNAGVTIPDQSVADTIKDAQDAAKKAGNIQNGIAITTDVNLNVTANSLTVTISSAALDKLIAENVKEFKIKSSLISLRFDLSSLKAIQKAGTGDIVVKAAKQDAGKLSAEVKQAIGSRPAFDLSVNRGAVTAASFSNGSVSVSIPYTPGAGETAGGIQAVYGDEAGKAEWLTESSYDADSKALIFATSHFSVFGIGYKAPVNYADISGHWAKTDMEFAVNRGLLNGTSAATFSPDTAMTRGMFVTALGRLAGVDVNGCRYTNFTDVNTDAYYSPYVSWAAQKGIVKGTGDTTFAPDQAVTRQEMAVIMENYAKVTGYTIPKTRAAVTFADSGSIASWAKDAVQSMQMAGIINGKGGNKFDPAAAATRAEACSVLHRYVELVIDPATAQGWTQNDAGQWMYYENGKPITGWKLAADKWYYLDTAGLMQSGGWKQINGKRYYFYPDGSMAVNTKIDGYGVGSDGVRK